MITKLAGSGTEMIVRDDSKACLRTRDAGLDQCSGLDLADRDIDVRAGRPDRVVNDVDDAAAQQDALLR